MLSNHTSSAGDEKDKKTRHNDVVEEPIPVPVTARPASCPWLMRRVSVAAARMVVCSLLRSPQTGLLLVETVSTHDWRRVGAESARRRRRRGSPEKVVDTQASSGGAHVTSVTSRQLPQGMFGGVDNVTSYPGVTSRFSSDIGGRGNSCDVGGESRAVGVNMELMLGDLVGYLSYYSWVHESLCKEKYQLPHRGA